MNATTLDALARRASREPIGGAAPSRRRMLGGLAGGLLAALPLAGRDVSAARKKRRPRPATAYQCPGPRENTFFGDLGERFAQAFTAERGGTLTQIRFSVFKEDQTGGWLVQLVAPGGALSNNPLDVLAAVTVPDAAVPLGDATLIGVFAGTRLAMGFGRAEHGEAPGRRADR
jgi:hypothetical protein